MKQLKFRAWDEDRMVEVVQLNLDTTEHLVRYEGKEYITNIGEEKVLQYIGLKDVKGEEIYEGDIVKQLPKEGYEHIIANGDLGIIKSSFGSCTIINAKDGRTHFLFYTEQEIIGNIYENPELLGDSQ